jgi:hypothetical protein
MVAAFAGLVYRRVRAQTGGWGASARVLTLFHPRVFTCTAPDRIPDSAAPACFEDHSA